MFRLLYISILTIALCGCYGVNSETSQIGNLNGRCLEQNAWEQIVEEHSTNLITDSIFKLQVRFVKSHIVTSRYVLYFDEKPKEIIGCDFYSVRSVYNPKLSNQVLDGLSPELTDQEQVRIRNRVQKELMKHQCSTGRVESLMNMDEPAIFGVEYYKQN